MSDLNLPFVAVAALGGTIAMAGTPETGLQPALDADQLLAAVPAAAGVARLHMTSLAGVGSPSLHFSHLLRLLAWAHQRADEGVDGIVVTQGTDAIEESAFFFQLVWSRETPVVFTAAMRGASAVGADGPANILAALQTVTSPEFPKGQVAVVLNDTIHSPWWVMKSHTLAVETFTSFPSGPLGRVVEGRAEFIAAAQTIPQSGTSPLWPRATLPDPAMPDVAIVATWPGDDGRLLDAVMDAGYAGVVIAGLGAGHVSEPFAARLQQHVARCPVVMATRVPFGPTARRTYSYPGSEVHLQRMGVLMSGWLSPQKSRIALWCLLAAGLSGQSLNDAFTALTQRR